MSWLTYNSEAEAGYVTRYPMLLASVPNIDLDWLYSTVDWLSTLLL